MKIPVKYGKKTIEITKEELIEQFEKIEKCPEDLVLPKEFIKIEQWWNYIN